MAKARTIHEVLVHLKDAIAAHLDGRSDVAQALLDEVEEALHGDNPDCDCREPEEEVMRVVWKFPLGVPYVDVSVGPGFNVQDELEEALLNVAKQSDPQPAVLVADPKLMTHWSWTNTIMPPPYSEPEGCAG